MIKRFLNKHMDTITGVGVLLFIMLVAGLMTHYVDGI